MKSNKPCLNQLIGILVWGLLIFVSRTARSADVVTGDVYGTVTKESGGGVWGQSIILNPFKSLQEAASRHDLRMAYAKTDWNGRYRFENVQPGEYSVTIDDYSTRRDVFYSSHTYKVVISSAHPQREVNWMQRKAGYVSGIFRWEDGKRISLGPVAAYYYAVHHKSGTSMGQVSVPSWNVDPNAYNAVVDDYFRSYKLGKFNPQFPASVMAVLTYYVGPYFVEIGQVIEGIRVRAGETSTADFTFQKFTSAADRISVSGNLIFPSDHPLESLYPDDEISVSAVRAKPYAEYSFITYYPAATGTSYELQGLPPGHYTVIAVAGKLSCKDNFDISDSKPIHKNIKLAPIKSIFTFDPK